MSTPEQPETPQLTRRQLRELRDTASNPIIAPESSAEAPPVVAPLARAAEPIAVSDEPPAAADVDLSTPARTRRSARQQERLRTASVAVVDGDAVDHAHTHDSAHVDEQEHDLDLEAEVIGETADEAPSGAEWAEAEVVDADTDAEERTTTAPIDAEVVDDAERAQEFHAETETEDDPEHALFRDSEVVEPAEADEDEAEFAQKPVVAPTFGSGLLAGEGVELELPASFDQLLSRGSTVTGSLAASNALILSQTPETGSFSSPVTATGEVLVTGTFALPESFGSTGTSAGSTDGKEIDAILIDGELPASSSPTPIAASAAISTIKSADDIIKPPAPEKGSRLMLALVITAGALALALTGVLIVALLTGAFH